jgi:hypothetical protein
MKNAEKAKNKQTPKTAMVKFSSSDDSPEFFKVFLPYTSSHQIVISLSLSLSLSLHLPFLFGIFILGSYIYIYNVLFFVLVGPVLRC